MVPVVGRTPCQWALLTVGYKGMRGLWPNLSVVTSVPPGPLVMNLSLHLWLCPSLSESKANACAAFEHSFNFLATNSLYEHDFEQWLSEVTMQLFLILSSYSGEKN